MFDIYGQHRVTGANATYVDDDDEEMREGDDIIVNLWDESINEPFIKVSVHGVSNIPHSDVVPQHVDSAPSSSIKSKVWVMEKYMMRLIYWPRNMICYMCYLPCLITLRNDM